MANYVTLTEVFEKKLKKLLNKFSTFGDTITHLERELVANPFMGDKLGHNVYKVRFADKSKGKGKRGGFRVITYLVYESKESIEIILLTLYDKSDQSTIQKVEITQLIKEISEQRQNG